MPQGYPSDKAVAKHIPKSLNDAITSFEKEIGGRDLLIEHFSIVDSPEMEYVVGLIADPNNADLSLAQICAIAKISLSKLLNFYRDAAGAKAQLRAFNKVYKLLPNVTSDLMEASLSQERNCYKCFGRKTITVSWPTLEDPTGTNEVICTVCNGLGNVTVQPDTETRRMALQLGGMIKLPGSPTVNVNTQVNQQNNTYNSEDARAFRSATDKILYPGKVREQPQVTIVDAEVVD